MKYLLFLLFSVLAPLSGVGQIKTDSKAYHKMLGMEERVVNTYAKVLDSVVCLQSIQNGGQASGSGTIVSEDGLILTAAHVVGVAEQVIVQMTDGRRASGDVLGCNYERDVAMVQILSGKDAEKTKWPHVDIGDSTHWDVADLYIAMGHPGGFDIRRPPPVRIGRAYNSNSNRFIVTDCVVIGGDSGGPLLDLDGNLIGIHSSIGASLGQNNHAPVHIVKKDWARLKAGEKWGVQGLAPGTVPVPRLGMRLENGDSLQIEKVHPDSPMERAGIQDGDVILKINGTRIEDRSALRDAVRSFRQGQEVEFEVGRDGKSLTKTVLLEDRKGADTPAAPDDPPPDPDTSDPAPEPAYFGAAFRTTDKGPRLSRLIKGGPAAKAKLKEGDVLYEIDGVRVAGPADIAAILSERNAGDSIDVQFYRDGEKNTLPLTLGRTP